MLPFLFPVIDSRAGSHDFSSRAQVTPMMRFDLNPEGWIHWPERADLSLEFMRLLATAQEGGSTVSECWLTARMTDLMLL